MSDEKVKRIDSPEEIDLLEKTAREIWNEYFPFLLEQEQIDYMLDKFLSKPILMKQLNEDYEYYFLVNNEDSILGFFVIHPEEEKLFLSKIYLKENARNQGLSNIMFDFIENRTRELGLDKIYLTVNKYNKLPINVYKYKGFHTVDSVVTDIGNGFFMDDFIMEKEI